MVEINSRPELPEIFPQTDVTVEGEKHTFQVAQLDSSTEPQLEYTLNKAPVQEVQSIQGIDQGGESRTFSSGVDYELASKTDTVQDTFTFLNTQKEYLLSYKIDTGTDSVSDESGTTYDNGTDYIVEESDEHFGDKVVWLKDGNSPDNNESFTAVYDVTFENSVVEWQSNGNNLPQADSFFYVTYRAESIISRYLDAHEEELDDVEEALQEVINNKFIDTATGESLDEIGKLFGPTIGKRRGRSDKQYRIYLRSVVQSFISRGTVNGIKLAISAATGVPIEKIEIDEDFTTNSYNVTITPVVPITGSLIEEVAEIADPSGVEQLLTRLDIDDEEIAVDDTISISEGQNILEDMVSADALTVNGNNTITTDQMAGDDTVAIDPNTFTLADSMAGNDTVNIDPNTFTVDDQMAGDDNVTVEERGINDFKWSDPDGSGDSWDKMLWTEITTLGTFTVGPDTMGSNDTLTIDPNTFTVGDDAASDDAVTVSVEQNAHWGNDWAQDSDDTSLLWTP